MTERLFRAGITRLKPRLNTRRRWKLKALVALILILLAVWQSAHAATVPSSSFLVLRSEEAASESRGPDAEMPTWVCVSALVLMGLVVSLAVVFAMRKQRENEEEVRDSQFAVRGSSLGGGKIVFMPFDEGSHALLAVVDELRFNQTVIENARRARDHGTALEVLGMSHRRNAVMIEVLERVVESRTAADEVSDSAADRSVRGPVAGMPTVLMAADGWNNAVWGVWALAVIGVAGIAALAWLLVHLRRNTRFIEELRRSQIERKAAHIAARRRDVEGASTVKAAAEVLPFTVGPLECLSEPFHVESSAPEYSGASCPHPQCDGGWLVCPDDPLAEGPCRVCGRFFANCNQEEAS